VGSGLLLTKVTSGHTASNINEKNNRSETDYLRSPIHLYMETDKENDNFRKLGSVKNYRRKHTLRRNEEALGINKIK
jgi:hypothetical protein